MKPTVFQVDEFLMTDAAKTRLHERAEVQRLSVEAMLSLPKPRTDVLGLLVNIPHPIQAALFDQFPNLKIVANYGVGVDHIDLEAANERGIWVSNAPGVLDKAVADMTVGLMIAACRRIVESHQTMLAQGTPQAFTGWTPMYQLGQQVTGRTLGILGLGEIGKQVAKRAHGFDMPVRYHNRNRLPVTEEVSLGVEYCSFEALLAESDILSIHVPLTAETRGLFHVETFAKMKRGAVLINTSRGPIVKEADLVEALRSGQLFAAGLDVFEQEPLAHPDLLTLPNVVMAAHIASASFETRQRMGDVTVDNLLEGLSGQAPMSPVNQPHLLNARI